MTTKTILPAPKEFGLQLKLYREKTGLDQIETANFFGMKQSQLANYELGTNSITIKKMEFLAAGFGVKYYYLANPNERIPDLVQMPDDLQSFVEVCLDARNKTKEERANQPKERTWSSKELHQLIDEGFFDQKKSSKQAFLKINPNISDEDVTNKYGQEIGKITSTLSKGKFSKLLDKLPAEGSTKVVYFIKCVN
ncbi:helix-turn-helix domain-containing protein [Sphingobacterium alkalisoli]|uniref:helix-turn-helix domain-containing protein n=1 Tax=Sphingobacterium alkalisoli TaxID=1874115 RepID=UPI00145FCF62|nr:helix-turn-helix transcriptional regulator [Sphingobacterium alkalisoli]